MIWLIHGNASHVCDIVGRRQAALAEVDQPSTAEANVLQCTRKVILISNFSHEITHRFDATIPVELRWRNQRCQRAKVNSNRFKVQRRLCANRIHYDRLLRFIDTTYMTRGFGTREPYCSAPSVCASRSPNP